MSNATADRVTAKRREPLEVPTPPRIRLTSRDVFQSADATLGISPGFRCDGEASEARRKKAAVAPLQRVSEGNTRATAAALQNRIVAGTVWMLTKSNVIRKYVESKFDPLP